MLVHTTYISPILQKQESVFLVLNKVIRQASYYDDSKSDQHPGPSGDITFVTDSPRVKGVKNADTVSEQPPGQKEIEYTDEDRKSTPVELKMCMAFPNDPALQYLGNKTRMTEALKQQMCAIGPCRPVQKDIENSKFPPSTQTGRNRSFNEKWYKRKLTDGQGIDRDWLEYSPRKDAMFCFACRLFSNMDDPSTESNWTVIGVSNWKKAVSKIEAHENTAIHLQSHSAWKIFKSMGRFWNSRRNGNAYKEKNKLRRIPKFSSAF
ncbi:Zinc finger MYM-type protein 5 [Holothuria leucospilota]|uniref:Zinc finger MYM-type protein 5 n=1 Tax=Holothuria leucospilota TaxID=206669 RepID=A0A9Q1HF10_HOLLE|nr:Zinc finger MYM-type protein 5 [Holothuria leucospilota]